MGMEWNGLDCYVALFAACAVCVLHLYLDLFFATAMAQLIIQCGAVEVKSTMLRKSLMARSKACV